MNISYFKIISIIWESPSFKTPQKMLGKLKKEFGPFGRLGSGRGLQMQPSDAGGAGGDLVGCWGGGVGAAVDDETQVSWGSWRWGGEVGRSGFWPISGAAES